jgi:hypothetical protein
MKRDWFNRGVRMQHQFGGIEERNDPLKRETWDPPDFPFRVHRLSEPGSPREIQGYGLFPYREDPSPICKPDHSYASTQGPKNHPDNAEAAARPVPVGTKKRSAQGIAWGPAQPDSSDFGYTRKP